ncbi:hypothetical protein FRB90_011032 [Tulasnella sp. 427]|nr:hypothetical protein FRB90_011032 [Tulasnella sp. 427]
MWKSTILLVAASLTSVVSGLGNSCSSALTPSANSGDPHWMQTITRRGKSAYNSNPSSYKVYRNVKDYGARGDGNTDDTAAINAAIADQSRCGQGCASSTKSPAIIFFPSGTYLVSTPIIPLYLTQLVGDAKNKPTLLASSNFNGIAVIDADPYIPGGGGAQYWDNQNNFFKSVRHFKIDTTRMPATTSGTGIHWQVAQATTLVDIEFNLNSNSNTAHQGIWMENGSGGFMSDLTVYGGKYGLWVGNQQFTVKNLKIRNAQVGVYMNWNWGWTFQGVDILNSGTGFQVNTGGTTQAQQTAGSEVIIDGRIENVQTFVSTTSSSSGSLAGSLLLDNIQFINVGRGVVDSNNAVKLGGGSTTIRQWAQGNKYYGTSSSKTYIQASVNAPNKPSALLDSNGYIYSRSRTDYPNYAASQFASVKDAGAVGDGVTDDTNAIQNFINKYWGCKILYFDAGTYYVSNTITIPTGSIVVGEIWTTVIGGGSNFGDQNNPRPVIKVGNAGDKGVVEISDMVFSARSGSAGAVVLEWNVADASGQKATAAMWDVHVRLGGFTGSGIQAGNCLKQSGHSTNPCIAAHTGIHITSQATAYFEGAWVWTADHDLDDSGQRQIDVYTGRGIVSESANGPVWLIGTASEHAAIVQYNFANSKNVYAGLIQTETAYYQPSPGAPSPFSLSNTFHDPSFTNGPSGWSLAISNSQQIFIYGAGHYSFFSNYGQDCLNSYTCQTSIVKVGSDSSNIYIYGLSTVGTTYMLNVDGNGIIKQSDNRNGFASTFTIWTSTTSTRKRMRIEGRKALANDSLAADIGAYARM